MAIDIKYQLNTLYKYGNIKLTKMEGGGRGEAMKYNKEIIQLADIFLIIKKEDIEEDKENNLAKKWYSGFFGILNMTIRNETDDVIIIYNKKLINILNEDKNMIKPNLPYIDQNNNLCFVKIDFYKNGEIINISYPNNLSLSFVEYIKEFSQLIIPKISSNLYSIV